MKIGDLVRVKFHHSKDWEKEKYKIRSIYLNDVIVYKAHSQKMSNRVLNHDMVELWD